MALLKRILFMILIVDIASIKLGRGFVNTTLIFWRCGSQSQSGNYNRAAMEVKGRLKRNTGRRGNNYYTSERVRDELRRRCYGHAICNQALSRQECIDCLQVTGTRLIQLCGFALSARVMLHDCYMRYSDGYFYEGCKNNASHLNLNFSPQGISELC
ncbi:hypothetical protein MLD38_025024 [Melastoma candidum]|uniref:Uncharacterized protein n=1 Tax=Melastoma candidum TaxID=119954 RepID=A0ACB9NX60_9MYRT|nr:hypothetical protein MLD38_025024 [Melastoma candidum]